MAPEPKIKKIQAKFPSVAIIVVNYNGYSYLEDCFSSLSRLRYPRNKISFIMVDNGSSDRSTEYVRSHFPEVTIIENKINNYTRANNIGAKASQAKYLALLNNDTIVDQDWLSELVKAMEADSAVGMAGSKILSLDGRLESAGHRELPDFYWQDNNDSKLESAIFPQEVASLCGCSVLLRKKALEGVGYFDEDFNMYLEDVELSLRLNRKDWKLVYVPKSFIRHVHHGTASDEQALFFSEKNRLLLIAKHYPQQLGSLLFGKGYFRQETDTAQEASLYKVLVDVVLKLFKHHRGEAARRALSGIFAALEDLRVSESRSLKDKIEELGRLAAGNEALFKGSQAGVSQLASEVSRLGQELGQSSGQLQETIKHNQRQQAEISQLKQDLQENNQSLLKAQQVLSEKDNLLLEKNYALDGLRVELTFVSQALIGKEKLLLQQDEYLKAQQGELSILGEKIALLQQEAVRNSALLKQKDYMLFTTRRDLHQKMRELKNIRESTAFRYLVQPLWSILWKIKQPLKILKKSITSGWQPAKSHDCLNAKAGEEVGLPASAIGICTIISKNYLAYARVLAESYLAHNLGQVFVLLTDKVEGYFDPGAGEKFTLIEMEALKNRVPDFERFCFQYSIKELNTAIKPFFLEYLFETYALRKIVFLDPDILVTDSLNEIFNILDTSSIVLVPHITQPYPDTVKPSEAHILKSGVYNLGFLGIARTDTTKQLLAWWKERLRRFCVSDVENGLFVDQKWMDLVPGFFEGCFILRDPGYNIAYWNYHYRRLAYQEGKFFVDNRPVKFLHFSGFDPLDAGVVSKHQDRYQAADLPQMKVAFALYRQKLFAQGYAESKAWPCAFALFDNGAGIPDIVRRIYWELPEECKDKFGDPFKTEGANSLFYWLSQPQAKGKPKITRLMLEIYKRRSDLQLAYRDIFTADRRAFRQWFLLSAEREYQVDKAFFEDASSQPDIFAAGLIYKFIYGARETIRICGKRIFSNNLQALGKLRKFEMALAKKITLLPLPDAPKRDRKISGNNGNCGVNVLGYINAEHGVGEAARSSIACLKEKGVKLALLNISPTYVREKDTTFSVSSKDGLFEVNLIHINADMLPLVYRTKGERFFKHKYNIGFWNWELADFPQDWQESFSFCDEVWVPSTFTLNALSRKSPIPVFKMPIAVEPRAAIQLARAHFGLKENEFVFLFVFDFLSYVERKNPLAVIKAFQSAFKLSDNVTLVIKCCNSSFDPQAIRRIREEALGSRMVIIDKYLYRDELSALMGLCDCYVSLHRCEGFGLTLAEAMLQGKPVIATGYSGNTDFMHSGNSFPVDYTLVEIEEDHGPYKKGKIWAEPDIQHAALLMRQVYEDYASAKDIARAASEHIKAHFNYRTVGSELHKRLLAIGHPAAV